MNSKTLVLLAATCALAACTGWTIATPTVPEKAASVQSDLGGDHILRGGPTPAPTIPKPGEIETTNSAQDSNAMLTMPQHVFPFVPGLTANDKIKTPDGAGQAGYITSAADDGAIYAAMSVEPNLDLPPPTNKSSNGNVLYAPTVHGANGNCLEITTAYIKFTPQIVRNVAVGDFCRVKNAEVFPVGFPIDRAFIVKYVRRWSNGDGKAQYIAEEVWQKDHRWHAYLYDAQTRKWDDVYASKQGKKSTVLGGDGWLIFETHFEYGAPNPLPIAAPCPRLPSIGASGFRTHGATGWITPPLETDLYEFGDCITGSRNIGPPTHPQRKPYHAYDQRPNSDMRWKVVTR